MKYSKLVSNKATPQSYPIPGRTDMAKNNAGGYVFKVEPLQQLHRFLMLGSLDGTFYVDDRNLTLENAKNILTVFDELGPVAVEHIVSVSTKGTAPSNKPALFALAMAFAYQGKNKNTVLAAAKEAVPVVARTGTDIMLFADSANELRGWGRGLKTTVGNWFAKKDAQKLGYQAIKYKAREGWSLRDLLRLSHPKAKSEFQNALFKFITSPTKLTDADKLMLPDVVQATFGLDTKDNVVNAIRKYNVPREAIPTEYLNDPAVWEALLERMPMTGLIRNLNKVTALGLMESYDVRSRVIDTLTNKETVAKSNVHPITFFKALHTYGQGKGMLGKLEWRPNTSITDALEDAFDASFVNVTPINKPILVGLDVSGSMTTEYISNMMGLNASTAIAVFASVLRNTEKDIEWMMFDTKHQSANHLFNKRRSVRDIAADLQKIRGGGTDLSMPFRYALDLRRKYDMIISLTDNETWSGYRHPLQVFDEYKKLNPNAKAVNVATTATVFSAMPNRYDTLQCAGFDSSLFSALDTLMRDS